VNKEEKMVEGKKETEEKAWKKQRRKNSVSLFPLFPYVTENLSDCSLHEYLFCQIINVRSMKL
jgi:hypothetical protein